MNDSPMSCRVLLVDDDDTFRRVLSAELERRGFSVRTAASGADALDLGSDGETDVILLDLNMPDPDGIAVLKLLRERDVAAGVVVLTGHGTIDTAIQAIRLGAYDYLEKPCPIAKVEMTIRKTCEHLGLLARQRVLRDGYTAPDVSPEFVGRSPAFRQLLRDIARIGGTDSTTLIVGETGVGKDMVAKLLHRHSRRREEPFVVVDCAALHEDLLQSELFGHEKGAFSGAARQKHGLFEVADGGSLFLDEVGEMSPDTQSMLLRVLETNRFRRVGGTREIEVDVRLLSATNRDLERETSAGRFRQDLWFRLTPLTIAVPPLRERGEDVPLLVEHFAARLNRRLSRSVRFDDEALRVLTGHSWPGNVRELMHVVEQCVVLADGDVVGAADLPPSVRAGSTPPPSEGQLLSLDELQRRHVQEVLDRVGQNRGKAARILGISERNLYRLIKKYGRKGVAGSSESALTICPDPPDKLSGT